MVIWIICHKYSLLYGIPESCPYHLQTDASPITPHRDSLI
nr:MAG TPA: hypothetical protein [Caudoviricetes sp.]